MQIRPVGIQLFHAHRQTENMQNLRVAFHNTFRKASTNETRGSPSTSLSLSVSLKVPRINRQKMANATKWFCLAYFC
jgi:hypothetical protein